MNKYTAPILTIAIVASLAGVLYIRANMDGSILKTDATATPDMADVTSSPSVYFAVRAGDDASVYAYDVEKGTTADASNYDGGFQKRSNQSADACEPYAGTSLVVFDCLIDDQGVLTMRVRDISEEGSVARSFSVDPRTLGITPSAVEGYLIPVAVSDDKSTIYLGRRVETESWVAGLWKLDVSTGKVSEVSYMREHDIYSYDINPATGELFGVSFLPPESLGTDATGPTAMYFVDLKSGIGQEGDSAGKEFLFENPMLSDDGARYSVYESGPWVGGAHTIILTKAEGRVSGGWQIDGVAKDWFGDTVVFDRDGNLFLYDLKTSTETQITHETDATVEYLGVAK